MHLLAFYECESGIVLDHFCVGSKKNEQSACIAILHPLLVKGRIISGDAIFSCREWCAAVHAYDGYYVIPIKENNPAVRRHLSEFFTDEGIDRSEFGSYKEVKKGHGRLEVREIWSSTQMNEWFEEEWSGIAQVFLIRRQIRKKGEERREMVYGMTSVPRKKANAKRSIENCLHYVRDVTFAEDRSRLRTGHAPQLLAACRNLAITLIHRSGSSQIAASRRALSYHPRHVFDLLLARASPQQ